jgi:hypothetical protein
VPQLLEAQLRVRRNKAKAPKNRWQKPLPSQIRSLPLLHLSRQPVATTEKEAARVLNLEEKSGFLVPPKNEPKKELQQLRSNSQSKTLDVLAGCPRSLFSISHNLFNHLSILVSFFFQAIFLARDAPADLKQMTMIISIFLKLCKEAKSSPTHL